MGSQTWAVVGGSGFAGSAVRAELAERGIAARAVPAPRLRCGDRTVHRLLTRARGMDSVIDSLADSLAGAEVVVIAAGLAAPDSADEPALIGANALLPVLVLAAARRTGARRVIHLSSAAVQGAAECLDESPATAPFSPYSLSKALGESALARLAADDDAASGPRLVILRATSVQGPSRETTRSLARLARSPLASVAGRGAAHTPVTSSAALAQTVAVLGGTADQPPLIVLQPWEGATTASVLRDAGGREPLHLPAPLCRALIGVGRLVSRAAGGRFSGAVRRVEVTWFGQRQVPGWLQEHDLLPAPRIAEVLRSMRG